MIHILEECQALQPERHRIGLPRDLRAILKEDSVHTEELFAFLKNISLFHRI